MELNLLYFELRIWRFRWKFSFAYEVPDDDEPTCDHPQPLGFTLTD